MYTLAYVTYQDICSIQAFQKQIVIAIKAPEETKLEIPIPKESEKNYTSKSNTRCKYLCCTALPKLFATAKLPT
ncbi:UNVERIFIED_CONTAM: hypothetical protein H355_010835 [Colinus virginianus]|nr:hypothetical protein H355_010835 [Colinus virginianus]